jgi:hypothetical protein
MNAAALIGQHLHRRALIKVGHMKQFPPHDDIIIYDFHNNTSMIADIAKAAEATAFVQEPEIFDKPYKGMGAEGGGVVGMLEVILPHLVRDLSCVQFCVWTQRYAA